MLVLPGFSSVKDGVHLDGLELLLFLVKKFLHLSIAFEMKLFSKMSLDNTECMKTQITKVRRSLEGWFCNQSLLANEYRDSKLHCSSKIFYIRCDIHQTKKSLV